MWGNQPQAEVIAPKEVDSNSAFAYGYWLLK